MNHILHLAEVYARHYQLEQQGYINEADAKYAAMRAALMAHSEAVSRSSVVAYREGRQGMPAHPSYTEWEAESWRSGVADSNIR